MRRMSWELRGVEGWLGPCNRLHIFVSRPVWKLPVIDVGTFESWKSLTTVNLIVSREAIPSEVWNVGHDWTFKLFYYDTPDCGNTFSNCSNWWNKMQKLTKKFRDHLYKYALILMTKFWAQKSSDNTEWNWAPCFLNHVFVRGFWKCQIKHTRLFHSLVRSG